jgi:hypothetical protein
MIRIMALTGAQGYRLDLKMVHTDNLFTNTRLIAPNGPLGGPHHTSNARFRAHGGMVIQTNPGRVPSTMRKPIASRSRDSEPVMIYAVFGAALVAEQSSRHRRKNSRRR